MKATELRRKYIDFFVEKGHVPVKSAPLIPENDPTVLFTTAGMHPLVPFLLGEKHPLGKRLVNCQKCVRTGDIDEVGDGVHLTFFEMLGNWSFGDYFKANAIEYSFEFLTSSKWLSIPADKLAVSVFVGDNDSPFDDEAFRIWRSLGINEQKIAKLPKKDNWWGPAGQTGPCGPDTEMFYWTGNEAPPDLFNPADKRWVEIWNDVFMQYFKTANGTFEPLQQRNVDTGMGLERTLAVLQSKNSVYETELFLPIINELKKLEPLNDPSGQKSERIIADHMRAATFIMADGIAPGNVDQSYIVRRLIRRSIREAKKIGINGEFTHVISEIIINNYKEQYPELEFAKNNILNDLKKEENTFRKTLEKGIREFEKFISKKPAKLENGSINGKNAFFLYETYGFPIELTEEMAKEKGLALDRKGFDEAFVKHQELSRKGAEEKFKGGLIDNSELTTKLHTATHLLLASLRKVCGEHIQQKGSNITPERLRFDFSHPQKLSQDEIKKVEDLVNSAIKQNLPINCMEMTLEEANKIGAIGVFTDRYGEKVKVYSAGNISVEICGGPHAKNTGSLGHFKIVKEESSSQGVRRIKAVLE